MLHGFRVQHIGRAAQTPVRNIDQRARGVYAWFDVILQRAMGVDKKTHCAERTGKDALCFFQLHRCTALGALMVQAEGAHWLMRSPQ